jgi:hypothetical protein
VPTIGATALAVTEDCATLVIVGAGVAAADLTHLSKTHAWPDRGPA